MLNGRRPFVLAIPNPQDDLSMAGKLGASGSARFVAR